MDGFRKGVIAVARFRQYQSESLIKNLTHTTYRVYSSFGGFVTFEPTIYSVDDPEETYYICNTGSKDWLEKHGVSRERLFFASCQGTGQDGQLIWVLNPYQVENPRLIPHRES